MQTLLIRCLIINFAALLLSGALLLWIPKDNGFTITSGWTTHFLPGGAVRSSATTSSFGFLDAVATSWHCSSQYATRNHARYASTPILSTSSFSTGTQRRTPR
jgi:hypothetical protein